MRKTLQKLLLAVPWQDSIKKRKYRLYVQAQEIQLEDDSVWLRVMVYEDKTAYLAVFCNRESREFYTWKVREEKWSEEIITHLEYRMYNREAYGYVERESQTVGRTYLGSEIADMETIPALRAWQIGRKEWLFRERFERGQRRTRELMEQLKPLPEDINRYIDNVVMREYRYLYYRRVKGRTLDCFCSHCREHMTVEQPRRLKGQLINQTMTCPHCGSRVILKSEARAPWIRETGYFSYLERVRDGVMIRNFAATWRFYNQAFRPPDKWVHEEERIFLSSDGKQTHYQEKARNGLYGRMEPEWVSVETEYSVGSYYNQCIPYNHAYIYPSNLYRVLRNTPWKYSAMAVWARHQRGSAARYLEAYRRYPCMEYVVKLGLYRLADALVKRNDWIADEASRKVTEVIGVSKQDLRTLQKLNVTADELYFWRFCRLHGCAISESDIREIRKLQRRREYGGWRTERLFAGLLETIQYASLKRCLRYIRRQDGNSGYVLGEWKDYLNMSEKIGRDMESEFVLFPPDLKKAHDEAVPLYEVKKDEWNNQAIAKVYSEGIGEYGYQDNQYIVTMPRGFDDIVAEGDALHHCVKKYAEKVADGECVILFVREAAHPDKPFYTAEVRDGKVWQLRGMGDCAATDEVAAFWEKYKKQVLSKIQQQQRKGAA